MESDGSTPPSTYSPAANPTKYRLVTYDTPGPQRHEMGRARTPGAMVKGVGPVWKRIAAAH
jgi:hypothetical protein